ncbi:uncharacterized protein Nmag_0862 [Natrialba magadii ATCC 43099]|uniref:DUF5658 domain-containing protein n=1 Tax=Natrialba magadii (strain ATCC 43099 / DSM 3394 / CCM 3739 / CIP 104546 / IAM 13178 / JCM 8861 / NBRC 102185 / NCIMB 2190 / MS3) TaxID=547559 RepID=D3T088_NATMM|nr:hypothetical protein [Natrialba magadii]ADD04446.1 uncharacterized protein Nmag_0862 [Natrialba magadii ATCC 43099]ELY25841.1 hypothetical protein C500_16824 [Natrialba magadii ATCC 43099]
MPLSSTLWLAAVLTYGIGDLVTTAVGLRHTQIEEGMPFARQLLGEPPSAWGVVRFGLFKIVLFAAFYLGAVAMARFAPGTRVDLLVPLAITVVGVAAVGNNVRVIRQVRGRGRGRGRRRHR